MYHHEDSNNHGTYLEDFLSSLDILPNKFRRDLGLLKELDREVYELNKEIIDLENKYLENLMKFKNSTDNQEKQGIIESNQKIKNDLFLLNDRVNKKLSNKTGIAQNFITMIDQFGNKLDNDLGIFENELKGGGDYEAPRGIPPDSEVLEPFTFLLYVVFLMPSLSLSQIAFRITIDPNDQTLILGQVLNYKSESNMYEIIDIDDHQKYTLPESHVLALGQADLMKKISKGENIYALYPDTTIFYPAVIIQAPKRSVLSSESIVTVQFLGDEDEAGFTPNRTVPLKYIVRA